MGPGTDWHLHFPVIQYWPQSRVSSCLCIHNCRSIILCLLLHLVSECPCHPCDPATLGLWMEIWWAYYGLWSNSPLPCQNVNHSELTVLVCGPTVHCLTNHICLTSWHLMNHFAGFKLYKWFNQLTRIELWWALSPASVARWVSDGCGQGRDQPDPGMTFYINNILFQSWSLLWWQIGPTRLTSIFLWLKSQDLYNAW